MLSSLEAYPPDASLDVKREPQLGCANVESALPVTGNTGSLGRGSKEQDPGKFSVHAQIVRHEPIDV